MPSAAAISVTDAVCSGYFSANVVAIIAPAAAPTK
jgi:hypothetical protein